MTSESLRVIKTENGFASPTEWELVPNVLRVFAPPDPIDQRLPPPRPCAVAIDSIVRSHKDGRRGLPSGLADPEGLRDLGSPDAQNHGRSSLGSLDDAEVTAFNRQCSDRQAWISWRAIGP